MMWGYPWSGAMMLWMGLSSIFWLVIVGVLIWVAVRLVMRHGPFGGHGPSALEVLQQRFARGEIDATTYERMREHLTDSPTDEQAPTLR